MEKAKNIQRAAKGSLTRVMQTTDILINAERPCEELRINLDDLTKFFEALLAKHEEYTILLDDEEFEEAEIWMQRCMEDYNECKMRANDYIREKTERDKLLQVNINKVVNDNEEFNDVNVNVNEMSM